MLPEAQTYSSLNFPHEKFLPKDHKDTKVELIALSVAHHISSWLGYDGVLDACDRVAQLGMTDVTVKRWIHGWDLHFGEGAEARTAQ